MGLKHSQTLENALDAGKGILRLDPAWVARDFLAPGKRLRLADCSVDDPRRGFICERWIASVTEAANTIPVANEGLSHIRGPEGRITLKEAFSLDAESLLGAEYAKSHDSHGLLCKLFDYLHPLPFHIHLMEKDASLVGRNSKDEAYFFPAGAPMGAVPTTYLGLNPDVEPDTLLPYLEQWDSDEILSLSNGYALRPNEGFLVHSGILHAPGTPLTLEIQEDSDNFAFLQAKAGGEVLSQDFLWKDFPPDRRGDFQAIFDAIDWEANRDPDLENNRRLTQIPVESAEDNETWIFYGTDKFSGKRVTVAPGAAFETVEPAAYAVLVWDGKGLFGELPIEAIEQARQDETTLDELFVAQPRAAEGVRIENTGQTDLTLFKFFGRDAIPKAADMKPGGRQVES